MQFPGHQSPWVMLVIKAAGSHLRAESEAALTAGVACTAAKTASRPLWALLRTLGRRSSTYASRTWKGRAARGQLPGSRAATTVPKHDRAPFKDAACTRQSGLSTAYGMVSVLHGRRCGCRLCVTLQVKQDHGARRQCTSSLLRSITEHRAEVAGANLDCSTPPGTLWRTVESRLQRAAVTCSWQSQLSATC